MKTSAPLIVNFGGGVDSTGALVGLEALGIRPDLIIFSDTGGEKPETYAYLAVIGEWLARVGFPELTIVKYRSSRASYDTLEGNMVTNETLPSMAYGRGTCSQKFKAEVMDKWLKGASRGSWKGPGWAPFHAAHDAEGVSSKRLAVVRHLDRLAVLKKRRKVARKILNGIKGRDPATKAHRRDGVACVARIEAEIAEIVETVGPLHAELLPHLPVKCIGYDDSEADRKRTKRVKDSFDPDFNFRYPLQEWGWTRERCIEEIKAAGLPVPLKSACFFCPASQKWEVKWLAAKHPELFLRAIAMEDGNTNGRHADKVNPEGDIGCGLGMTFRWRNFAEAEGFLEGNEIVGDRAALMAAAMAEKPAYEANSGSLPCNDSFVSSDDSRSLAVVS